MKKNVKILIIVSVAAVLLVGLMLLLIFLPKDGSKDGATYDEGISMSTSTDENGVHQASINTDKNGNIENNSYGTLIDYVPADISLIHVENDLGTLEVTSYTPTDSKGESDATVYTIKGYEDFDLQPGIADSIANQTASLDFSKVMTLDKSKSSDYGFDKPRATVTVTYTDKTKAVIILGGEAPQGTGAYVKFGSSDTIYLVSVDSVSAYLYGINDYISLTINDSASNEDNGKASSITLSGSNFPDTIVLKPNNDGKNSASYVMTQPNNIYANENESSLVEGAIRGLYAESVKMVNPSSSQLSSLGLSSPYAEVSAVYPDTSVNILSSKPDGEGKVYVMEKGGKVVYVMASSNLPWVTTSYEKLVSEYVLNPKMNALSGMSVNDGKKTYDYTLSSKDVTTTDNNGNETTSTTTTVKCENKEIELSYFSTFYQNITLTELADAKTENISGNPVFSVTYKYSADGSSDSVSFYSASNSRYLAVVNGKAIGHVYPAGINKLIKQAEQIASNKQVDNII